MWLKHSHRGKVFHGRQLAIRVDNIFQIDFEYSNEFEIILVGVLISKLVYW
jgi:hypothetical protein